MDSFAENVMERARKRGKLLHNIGRTENADPSLPIDLNYDGSSTDLRNENNACESNVITTGSKTKISTLVPGSPGLQHNNIINFERADFAMEISLASLDKCIVQVEIQEDNGSNAGGGAASSNPVAPSLREESKQKLRRLGKLCSGGGDANIPSPIHRTESNFHSVESKPSDNMGKTNNLGQQTRKGLGKGLIKLAALAENINQWEDEVTARPLADRKMKIEVSSKEQVKVPESANRFISRPNSNDVLKGDCNSKSFASKHMKWDKSVIDSLESQGFTRSEAESKLTYKFKSSENYSQTIDNNESTSDNVCANKSLPNSPKVIAKPFIAVNTVLEEEKVTPRSPKQTPGIASRAAMFETTNSPSRCPNTKDPSLLSVCERKALFEKNSGTPLIPKAAFAMAVPKETVKPAHKQTNSHRAYDNSMRTLEASGKPQKSVIPQREKRTKPSEMISNTHVTVKDDKTKNTNSNVQKGTSDGIANKIAAFSSTASATISQLQIEKGIRQQRQDDMDLLLGRFNRNKEITEDAKNYSKESCLDSSVESNVSDDSIPNVSHKRKSTEKQKGDSPQVQAVLECVKRICVKERRKEGRLYPCLSDIETATDAEQNTNPSSLNVSDRSDSVLSETEDTCASTSFERGILNLVHKPANEYSHVSFHKTKVTDILDDMDEFLSGEYDECTAPTPPKMGKLSSSPLKNKAALKVQSPCSKVANVATRGSGEPLPAFIVDGNDVMPLQHTVSFYRKQQSNVPNLTTPKRILIEHSEEAPPSGIFESSKTALEQKIQELKYEVEKQEKVIAQSSQALNLCNSRLEFNGSTEQVEAEKLLLIATHRRQSTLYEIGRIQVEGLVRYRNNPNIPVEDGTLTISNIVLPLKKEYVRALGAAGGKGHHVVCLVKTGCQVVSTKLVSTVASSPKNPELDLSIPGQIRINNVFGDSTVTFEVYCLQALEELLPHDIKYHIKKPNQKLTPKKMKHDGKMTCPPMESPGGPQIVRSSTFALMGYIIFSVQGINKKQWNLNKTPQMSPLEGSVEMKISCEWNISVEKRGFLTMFEDISGFGAWHRRWYLLKAHTLSYWKYPDDERKKAPIGTINLELCTNKEISLVPREICARLHTLLIEQVRSAEPTDGDKITTVCKGEQTVVRYLLSADGKEDRIAWSNEFNKALSALRVLQGPK